MRRATPSPWKRGWGFTRRQRSRREEVEKAIAAQLSKLEEQIYNIKRQYVHHSKRFSAEIPI
jgi:hypothetical protein